MTALAWLAAYVVVSLPVALFAGRRLRPGNGR
jgi:hypothetical protein